MYLHVYTWVQTGAENVLVSIKFSRQKIKVACDTQPSASNSDSDMHSPTLNIPVEIIREILSHLTSPVSHFHMIQRGEQIIRHIKEMAEFFPTFNSILFRHAPGPQLQQQYLTAYVHAIRYAVRISSMTISDRHWMAVL